MFKIKGHKNESYPISASLSDKLTHVICGSEDGEVFLWSQIYSTVEMMSKRGMFGKLLNAASSNSVEYF